MKMAYIEGKMVNVDNILYINHYEAEQGHIHCLFVLSDDIVLKEIYKNRNEFKIKMYEYGIWKFTTTMAIKNLLYFVLNKISSKIKQRKIKRIK